MEQATGFLGDHTVPDMDQAQRLAGPSEASPGGFAWYHSAAKRVNRGCLWYIYSGGIKQMSKLRKKALQAVKLQMRLDGEIESQDSDDLHRPRNARQRVLQQAREAFEEAGTSDPTEYEA